MLHEIADIIYANRRFIVAGHINPDGDTIGSCLGLALALEKMGKLVVVVLEPYGVRYQSIPGAHLVADTEWEGLQADVLIALDCAEAARLGAARALLERVPVTVCIDHHETNKGFAQYNLVNAEASSASEIVLGLIETITTLDADIAAAIYAGMVSDTGGFRYSGTNKATMEHAARLMEQGIPFAKIYDELLHQHSYASSKALGVAIYHSDLVMDGRIILSCVTRESLAKEGVTPADLDGVVEYLMSTRGVEVALFVSERAHPPHVKISLRSRNINVGRVASRWGGGGHRLAAGCTVDMPTHRALLEMAVTLADELDAQDTQRNSICEVL